MARCFSLAGSRHYISNLFKCQNTELPPCFVMDNCTKKQILISTVTKKSRCWWPTGIKYIILLTYLNKTTHTCLWQYISKSDLFILHKRLFFFLKSVSWPFLMAITVIFYLSVNLYMKGRKKISSVNPIYLGTTPWFPDKKEYWFPSLWLHIKETVRESFFKKLFSNWGVVTKG